MRLKLDKLHLWFRQNRWLWLFTQCTKVLLAFAFIVAGHWKIIGERFTSLSSNHPMGQYLDALFYTGYYYTFIGIMQVLAAILILIPRTVVLGVLLYLSIIANITVLSFSVRFDGSIFTSPLMTIACIYLLWWHWDRVKYILPIPRKNLANTLPKQKMNNKFPLAFAGIVILIMVSVVFVSVKGFDVMPKNHIKDCSDQFVDSNRTEAGKIFCECIHQNGTPLDECLELYYDAPNDLISN